MPLLLLHLAICMCLGVFAFARRREPELWSALLMLGLWTFFAGALGALVGMGIAFAGGSEGASAYGEWFERRAVGDRDRVRSLASALRGKRLRIEGAFAARPLRDVIASGSLKEKFDALNALGRTFDPSLASALHLARRDPDQSVRVLAATVAIKLQTRFSSDIEARQSAARREQTIESLLALAWAHARFARSGLLPAKEAQDQFEKAAARHQEAFDRASESEPGRFRLIEQMIQEIEEQGPVVFPKDHGRGGRLTGRNDAAASASRAGGAARPGCGRGSAEKEKIIGRSP
jgi:hypothetical protein